MRRLIMLTSLTVLIIFSTCKSVPEPTPASEAQAIVAAIAPSLPLSPVMEPVRFEDRGDGGLWLSYESYRALERNVIALREYTARLEIIISFYREEYR